MGRSSEEKMKRGGNDGRSSQLKDHGSNADEEIAALSSDDEEDELLSEEITALYAKFQEDCKIVSGPRQIVIKLRPYSKSEEIEDTDISALLTVVCLPGYPSNCPMLKIAPEQGLTTANFEKLFSLLQDQANSNAHEGRAMIFNLVEAAKQFLSEIIPDSQDGTTESDIIPDSQNDTTEDDTASETLGSSSSDPLAQDQVIAKKNLLMVHLLRVACSSRGLLVDPLPMIANELHELGILSKTVLDLALKSSQEDFYRDFNDQFISSSVPQFLLPSSKYSTEFEVLRFLGKGGFGKVVLCRNKLDLQEYAVKIIAIKDTEKISEEVAAVSHMHHQHVVRYHQAWYETGGVVPYAGENSGSEPAGSDTAGSEPAGRLTSTEVPAYLFIQMEYCPKTLRDFIDNGSHKGCEMLLSRQILEALAHIHGEGFIHGDLTPNNIFLDANNEIKIADFGLEKMDVAESKPLATDFYRAPDITSRDGKADIYSFGVVFFELWCDFETGMERFVVLTKLKNEQELPCDWACQFREQFLLLERLLSLNASQRPSASDLLRHELFRKN